MNLVVAPGFHPASARVRLHGAWKAARECGSKLGVLGRFGSKFNWEISGAPKGYWRGRVVVDGGVPAISNQVYSTGAWD